MLSLDTNVLVDVLQYDSLWAEWAITPLRARPVLHALLINPIIHAEMSWSFSTLYAPAFTPHSGPRSMTASASAIALRSCAITTAL